MKIYIGADHRGFILKEAVKPFLFSYGEIVDVGANTMKSGDDYVDYAQKVADKVSCDLQNDKESRGIVICGSGVGVDIVANKFDGVRCGLGFSSIEIESARHDDDINMLALPADSVQEEQAEEIIKAFLETKFADEDKYERRIDKITELEKH